jgi:hypothetical protein
MRGFEELVEEKFSLGSFGKKCAGNQTKNARMSNNNITHKKEHRLENNYIYLAAFNKELCILLSKPILRAIAERYKSKQEFIRDINSKGFNYSYSGFVNVLKGENAYVTNFGYFSRIYEYLALPFPSISYLSSFE